MAKCGGCNGNGCVTCPKCGGRGEIDGGLFVGRYQCSNCSGSGMVKCGVCSGYGYV